MGLWEISFRARWDYPFLTLSGEYPGTTLSMWCVWDRELLHVGSRDPDFLDSLEKTIRKAGHIVSEWRESERGRLFLLECTCPKYESMWNLLSRHRLLEAPPFVYRDGWGFFRALAFDDRTTRGFFKELGALGEVELLRKRELPLETLPTTLWVHQLFGDLTGRQAEALLRAQRAGYYASPRSVTTDDVARSSGLSRSTFEEHLRKAENRLVASIAPYLELYASANHPADRLPLRSALDAVSESPSVSAA